MTLKIVSWNLNSIRSRITHLQEFIKEHNPDIIALQELKCIEENFPKEELEELGYNLYIAGQKTYNGVAILSKFPADEISRAFPGNPLPDEARFIQISANLPVIGYSQLICLYAPNGGEVGSDKFQSKLKFYDIFIKYLKNIKSFDSNIIICSDYNIAPYDIDVYDPNKLQNTTCFTLKEQIKLRNILGLGFFDNFRLLKPSDCEYSWWDYRKGSFEQNHGMRIDSILSTAKAANLLFSCQINYDQRCKVKPSDHAPVIATYVQ